MGTTLGCHRFLLDAPSPCMDLYMHGAWSYTCLELYVHMHGAVHVMYIHGAVCTCLELYVRTCMEMYIHGLGTVNI